jgi:hypothetical protein
MNELERVKKLVAYDLVAMKSKTTSAISEDIIRKVLGAYKEKFRKDFPAVLSVTEPQFLNVKGFIYYANLLVILIATINPYPGCTYFVNWGLLIIYL